MEHAGICDTGSLRKINQDCILNVSREDAGLFAVADGMGGHSHGEKASGRIVEKLAQWWKDFNPEKYNHNFIDMICSLKHEVQQANKEIYENYGQADICGAAMVLLFVCKDAYGILSAGDSRVYRYYGWKLRQLTVDEVWENQPELTPQERRKNWEQCHGRLYNAVGAHEEVQCRVLTDVLKPGMVFLLCSDGLYKYCPKQYLHKCVRKAKKENNLEAAAASLLSRVYKEGAKDNISIILVKTA